MFFLLEGICFFVIIRNNDYQNRVFISSANTVTGVVTNVWDFGRRWLNYSDDIKVLKKENAGLLSQLDNALYSYKAERDTVESEEFGQQFSFISATITGRSVLGNNNTLTINRGAKHGVQMHMGVTSMDGVVGVVTGVSEHFAKVMTILHKQTAISASVRRNGYFGSLVWKDRDYEHVSLEAIPGHVTVEVGDTIETSGYSDLFPKGIVIGYVTEVDKDERVNSQNVKVKLKVDLLNLRHVYVVDNLYKKEMEILNQEDNE
jgi:rod shape-determining protein MreC